MGHSLLKPLYQQLDECILAERQGFYRRLQKIRHRLSSDNPCEELLNKLTHDLSQSIDRVKQRQCENHQLNYPDELPVSQKKELILETIRDNQVTILCGETGSGKTTQLPKICLQLGLGCRGLIGHTQPRRLAARSVASRIAEELHTELGGTVGFKVRFTDKLSMKSQVKLMTDGILLAECHHDPYLNHYDTLIIDEAHERSLNIDFLLGYIKRLTDKRRDLKVIITSATIDPERFSKHFNNAPIIEVSGRTYPVEVRYRPLHQEDNEDDQHRDMEQGIVDAVNELSAIDRGDILVFLSGERDIRETADALQKEKLENTEILPLLARLSAAEQNRIFHSSSKRRIILSTNVAETSLTVPGIKYVIDTGLARISRYSWRSKIQRLPIENISQASANQRKGRCGRTQDGICIRLYDENDFNLRAEFTEPEIQRTNLAAVILQMEGLGLGHIDDFPFVEPPDNRLINDGYKLLFELGAIDDRRKLLKVGKKLARLPIDPQLGRMLLEAECEAALNEVLIIVAALATQDARERPMNKQQAADEKHHNWTDKTSDFNFYINLWTDFHKQKQALSGNKLQKWCKQHFLSWMRMREWNDTHRQIKGMLEELNTSFNTQTPDYASIHRSLLTGMPAQIGIKDEDKEFIGTRNRRFHLFPGSALFKKPPKWIMSADIVETSRVYARNNAKIEPQWVEEKAAHLLKRSYDNPHWEKRQAQVTASEQTTLYGLIINPARKVNYGPINPQQCREIFIHCALVQGDFDCKSGFFIHNNKLIEELRGLEAKSRRQDIVIDEITLYNFYDKQLPADIYNGPLFNAWLKKADKTRIEKLYLSQEQLLRHDAKPVNSDQFPDNITMAGSTYPLNYHFDTSHNHDGVTLVTPLAGLQGINAQRCEWLIPGMLHAKMVGLLRSLPKSLRRNFVPVPDYANACMEALQPSDTALTTAMANHLKKMTGTDIPYDAWRPELVDEHLFMNYRVIDTNGKTIIEGRQLQRLKDSLSNDTITLTEHTSNTADVNTKLIEVNKDNVSPEILDELPQHVELDINGVRITTYPALIKKGKEVQVRTLESRREAEQATTAGLRQLFINALPEQIKYLRNNIPNIQQLCMKYTDLGNCNDLKQDIINIVIDECFMQHTIDSSFSFNRSIETGRSEISKVTAEWCKLLDTILDEYKNIKKATRNPPLTLLDTVSDIQNQINNLFPPHFINTIDKQWIQQYPRYLRAISLRLEKALNNSTRDRQYRLKISDLWEQYKKRLESLEQQHISSKQLCHYRWMIEELRVSLFAQELKTLFPISEKRLKTYWSELSDA